MAIDLQKYTALKTKAEELQRDADKAAGAVETIRTRLRKEFKVPTIAAAKKLILELEQEEKKLEKEFEKALATFEKEFKDVLEL